MKFLLVIRVNKVDAITMKVLLEVNLQGQCAERLLWLLKMRRIERNLITDVVEILSRELKIQSSRQRRIPHSPEMEISH